MKKVLLMLMFFALLITGCAKQDNNEVNQDSDKVISGVYEIVLISKYEEDIDVSFDMPGANNDVFMTLTEAQLADFKLGDIVEIEFIEKQVCDADNPNKCMSEYELVSIKEGSGLYTEGYRLSEILGFNPVRVEILEPEWDTEDVKSIVLDKEDEIQSFLADMDELIIYKDCVEVYGAGEPVYTMKFYSTDEELVEVKDSFNVEVTYSNDALFNSSKMTFGIHRTEESSIQYSTLLQRLFEE